VLVCLLLCLPQRRRRLKVELLLLAVLVICGGLSGCLNSNSPIPDPGTTTGNYTVTVNATSGGVTSSVSFTMTLN
jgi:hypothetical protein